MSDAQVLVRAAEKLDPIPVSVTRLMTIVARDRWAISEVEQVIALDQALTGRLLQVANSAANAALMPVGTVKDAVIRVGVSSVLSFAMAAAVGPRFRRALPAYGLSEGELWSHSVSAALGCEVLVALSPVEVPPEAVTAALLHDVGKLVMARFLDADTLARLAAARAAGHSGCEAEREVLGIDHAELGGHVAAQWKLPPHLVRAITHHHAPDREPHPATDAAHIANIAAKLVGSRDDLDHGETTPSPSSVARLKLDPPFLERLCRHVARRYDEVLSRYEAATVGTLPRAAGF
jgi:putative nucleotidyltransferase with HDIG domain